MLIHLAAEILILKFTEKCFCEYTVCQVWIKNSEERGHEEKDNFGSNLKSSLGKSRKWTTTLPP